MRRKTLRVYRGPSIYSRCGVIRYTFEMDEAEGAIEPAAVDRLFALLPGLPESYGPCALATSSLHLFEHVAIELQRLTGAEIGCVRAGGARIMPSEAVVPYEYEEVG